LINTTELATGLWSLTNSEIRRISLIYRATENGWECSDYYNRVLDYNNTVTFFNLRNNCLIGVLVRVKWSQLGTNRWEETANHYNITSLCEWPCENCNLIKNQKIFPEIILETGMGKGRFSDYCEKNTKNRNLNNLGLSGIENNYSIAEIEVYKFNKKSRAIPEGTKTVEASTTHNTPCKTSTVMSRTSMARTSTE
jgi:hypothetical protein